MYKHLLRPLLFKLTSDYAHEVTIKTAASVSKNQWFLHSIGSLLTYKNPALEQKIFGLTFQNPIGLAAGFDKNATTIPIMEKLGFGFVEVGSITANPSTGNAKPRSFRLPKDLSLINRLGLNNDGAQTISRRLKRYKASIPVGINIAKTHNPDITGEKAVEDYKISFNFVKDFADYITLNISCPNTTEGKTFEDPTSLHDLLDALHIGKDASLPPVLVKLSADLDDSLLDELLHICEKFAVDGYIAVNTSSGRERLKTSENEIKRIGRGGLSGKGIAEKSTQMIKKINSFTKGEKIIIGVGGIFSGEDAIEKLKAGADLLQIYTGLVYNGPGLVKKINREIASYLKKNDLSHIYLIRQKKN